MKQPSKAKKTTKKPPVKKEWLGWHFADATEKLGYDDGRKIKVGETHTVACIPVLCERGLHASKSVIEALQYAPGNILYRVRLSGNIVHGDDKSVATERTYLARIDAEPILREFARKCALSVIHLWDCPRIVKEYLETGDESKRAAARDAAWDAARAAARDAAWAAAWDAAWDAARDAARDAAWAAARDAAWAAARDAARDAAWDAAWDAQKKMLDKMVLAAIEKQKP